MVQGPCVTIDQVHHKWYQVHCTMQMGPWTMSLSTRCQGGYLMCPRSLFSKMHSIHHLDCFFFEEIMNLVTLHFSPDLQPAVSWPQNLFEATSQPGGVHWQLLAVNCCDSQLPN